MVQAKLANSSSEARRLVQGGAVEIDSQKVTDHQFKVKLTEGAEFIVKAGKKKFAKIKVNS